MPLVCTVVPKSRYKQKDTASQTRVLKKKRTYSGVLDRRIQVSNLSTSMKDVPCLLCVPRAGIQPVWQLIRFSVDQCPLLLVGASVLLTLITYFENHPQVTAETFLPAPKGDSN